jgi:hypothetical protein
MVPVPKSQGISEGYLRPADGIVQNGVAGGSCRGGVSWNGVCYRVMGEELVIVSEIGTVTEIGSIPGVTPVKFDYSFDRLAIAAEGLLYYYNGSTITQVTDADLGYVQDVCWVDGYFMTTDGTSLIVTELNDPMSINPLKYGSSEADPDRIQAIVKVRNEVSAVNRYTIETFDNVGGDYFPFQRIQGALIPKGSLSRTCCTVFQDMIAFVGGGKNEPPAVYLAENAQATRVSTREIDQTLRSYTETELAAAYIESKISDGHANLLIHLVDRTLVFDLNATKEAGQPVWYTLTSGVSGFGVYAARYHVWCYGKWLVGSTINSNVGYLDGSVSTHWGKPSRWEFSTSIIYNAGMSALIHEMELVCLTGRVAFGSDPRVSTSHSFDGVVWSDERSVRAGGFAQTATRIKWLKQGKIKHWRIQRFQGHSDAFLTVARLEMKIEPLAV